jgi:hypothetical protein
MNARPAGKTARCGRTEARTRLEQATAMVLVADLALSDDTNTATPGVAAALAVLAGIAASDAACCATLGQRPRGQAHGQAPALLSTVEPHGRELAKDLSELLAAKDDSHYGVSLVSRVKAQGLLRRARHMVETAGEVLNR